MLLALLQFFSAQFLYLALHLESGSFPRPLTPKEEAAAFAALRAGGPAARETIIQHNLRLVAHIAKKYYALPGDQDDLISIGTIGLIKAVGTFDSTRRARFSTYASRCIENEIRMQFRREKKTGPTVSLQESLDTSKDDSALTLSDLLQDTACMEENLEKKADAQRLRLLIEALPARERQLVLLRYGLAGQPPLTQLETAQLLGISRSYVSHRSYYKSRTRNFYRIIVTFHFSFAFFQLRKPEFDDDLFVCSQLDPLDEADQKFPVLAACLKKALYQRLCFVLL